MHHYIGLGNPDQLSVIADWVGLNAHAIVKRAGRRSADSASLGGSNALRSGDYAAYVLSLLGSRKLCQQMVEKSPWSIAAIFRAAGDYPARRLPIAHFARNIGTEFVQNSGSPLHTEDDWGSSGFLGYTKRITTTVYGNFDLVEGLATTGGCPLDLNFEVSLALTAQQLEAYSRGVLIFSKAYFAKATAYQSYAFNRALGQFERSTGSIRTLGKLGDDFWRSDDYKRLEVTIAFIQDLIDLLAKHPTPAKRRGRNYRLVGLEDVHAQIANLIYEIILASSYIATPVWTCWSVQHNAIWSKLFDFDNTASGRLVRFHLRRLMYDAIKKMEDSPTFVGARIIGYCLNVMGISDKRGMLGQAPKDRYLELVDRAA